MFEFTEDKKGIRPKWIGSIENTWLRRAMMVIALPPTICVVICYNLFLFLLIVLLAFARFVAFGTVAVLLRVFTKPMWELWYAPRRPVVQIAEIDAEPLKFQCTDRYDLVVSKAPIVEGKVP